jgi:F-type H+-transporting ATPase subunit a
MADPIFHIKDSFYFEVPKKLWKYDFQSEAEVPAFLLRESQIHNTHPTLDDYENALHGKILIPQPLGTLKNFYEKDSGFCVSKFMILELFAAVLLALAFIRVAKAIGTGERPVGKFANLFELILVYLRDQVARPAFGGHDADKFLPYLWTVFFFVLANNLLGLIPFLGSATGSFSVTLALALATFLTVLISGTIKFGVLGFWKNQVPHLGLPWYLGIFIVPGVWLIEVMGLFIKHGVLSVRLLANIACGHLVLLAFMGMAVAAGEAMRAGTLGTPLFSVVVVISVLASTAISLLELLVAFLQAYVFTFLSALFIGAAVHHH